MLVLEGTCKDGNVTLADSAPGVSEARVLVTFLGSQDVNLTERGIDREHAMELRSRFGGISEDWNRPEMDIYDTDWARRRGPSPFSEFRSDYG